MPRRYYSSTAARTTLASGVDDTTTTFSVVAVSGWPSSFPYTLIIDQDTVNEEIVQVTNRSGTTLTVTRAQDGTTAKAHDGGAAVNHGVSARDFDEPNSFINGTGFIAPSVATTKGDILAASGNAAVGRVGVGANDTVLVADSGQNFGIKWSSLVASQVPSLESSKVPISTLNAQTGTSYTFVASDAGKLVTFGSASGTTVTIPSASSVSYDAGATINTAQVGAGQVTFAAGAGVTLRSSSNYLKLDGQYSGAQLCRIGTNEWLIVGKLKA